jgi:hypothetical protein
MEKVSLESEMHKQAVIRLAMKSLSLEHAFKVVIERGLFECSGGNWGLMGLQSKGEQDGLVQSMNC